MRAEKVIQEKETAAPPKKQLEEKDKGGETILVYKLKIPYPTRLKKDHTDDQFMKILKLF